jgi:transcription elongation factor Elf1
MELQQSVEIQCPYCGETISVIVDCSIEFQDYIEDCSVCCRPISLAIHADEDQVKVIPRHENE